jgi:hypothetical protein
MEKCPQCNTELKILRSFNRLEGDDSPDTPTVLYAVIEQTCRNPQCPNDGLVVDVVEHQVQLNLG